MKGYCLKSFHDFIPGSRGGACAGAHTVLGLQEPGLLGITADGE